jgi:hypothetical protein
MNGFRHLSLSILVVVLVLLSINISLISAGSVQNETHDNMQGLLEGLVEKMYDEPGLIIFITFANPLVGDETTWGIGDPDDTLERRIVEIGEDYLCFRELAGGADGRRCTPFSNIVSISYLNN